MTSSRSSSSSSSTHPSHSRPNVDRLTLLRLSSRGLDGKALVSALRCVRSIYFSAFDRHVCSSCRCGIEVVAQERQDVRPSRLRCRCFCRVKVRSAFPTKIIAISSGSTANSSVAIHPSFLVLLSYNFSCPPPAHVFGSNTRPHSCRWCRTPQIHTLRHTHVQSQQQTALLLFPGCDPLRS